MALVYPENIFLVGMVYDIDGRYTATDTMYNGYPIYQKPGDTTWSVYYRKENLWVADFNAVDDQWSVTAAYWHGNLFASAI